MRYCLFFLVVTLTVANCDISNRQSQKKGGILENLTTVGQFNKDEKAALDSISSLGLDILYRSCLRYLYTLYGSEVLTAYSRPQDSLTIGECNIRLIGFGGRPGRIKSMTFGVFLSDSIPADAILQTSWGAMINTFDVDVDKRELLCGSTGGSGVVSMSNIRALYDSAIVSTSFKDYLAKHKSRIHLKFKKAISNL